MHRALQRVIVRMLYDPSFADRVYEGAEVDGIDTRHLRLLLATPRQAFSTDPYRRSRNLRFLVEEFPASSAMAAAALGGVESLDHFFSTDVFHRCIQERGSLSLTYIDWIAHRAEPVAVLERAFCRARRCHALLGDGYVLTAGVEPVGAPEGALERTLALRSRLGKEPVQTLLNGPLDLQNLPEIGSDTAYFLVELNDEEVSLSQATSGICHFLEHARTPTSRSQLESRLIELGATPDEAKDVFQTSLAEGLLTRAASFDGADSDPHSQRGSP